jgi:hypothetical protein
MAVAGVSLLAQVLRVMSAQGQALTSTGPDAQGAAAAATVAQRLKPVVTAMAGRLDVTV